MDLPDALDARQDDKPRSIRRPIGLIDALHDRSDRVGVTSVGGCHEELLPTADVSEVRDHRPVSREPRTLARRDRPDEDRFEVIRNAMLGILTEPGAEVPLEIVAGGHDTGPSAIPVPTRASASSAARISPRARWRRDFAVPIGIPSV